MEVNVCVCVVMTDLPDNIMIQLGVRICGISIENLWECRQCGTNPPVVYISLNETTCYNFLLYMKQYLKWRLLLLYQHFII